MLIDAIVITSIVSFVISYALLWSLFRTLLRFMLTERDPKTMRSVCLTRQEREEDTERRNKRQEEEVELRAFQNMIMTGQAPKGASDMFEEVDEVVGSQL